VNPTFGLAVAGFLGPLPSRVLIVAPVARGAPVWSRSVVSIQVSGGSVFSNDEKKPRALIPLPDQTWLAWR
jgi:hypothetical protein